MNAQPVLLFTLVLALTACGGGGGGGGGGPTPGPIQPPNPQPATPSPQASGIVTAAAGDATVRVDVALPGTGFEAALFQGTSAGNVYAAAPVQGPMASASAIVTGLPNGSDVFFGLGIRAAGATAWTPVGSVVRTRPGMVLYVDAAASGAGANGLTPATAFPSLQDALLVAGAANGGNVWVRAGTYAAGPYALGPNVHCAGGFGASFDLATRDVSANLTALTGSTSQEIISVLSGGADGTLDGFTIDAGGTVLKGVDVVDGDVELRSLVIRGCIDRGIKAVTTVPIPNRRIAVIGCNVTSNGGDGFSSAGAIDVVLDLSAFDANGQEGADVDDLQCPDNGSISLRATACRFYGNGFEGLDVDLAAAPLSVGTGTFDVRVDNCRFEVNGLDGLLIDQEHEAFPGFAATIVVRGCLARGNRAAGVHVDADAAGSYCFERLRCTANAGDGVLVTSETNAGEILLSGSWLAGNLGHGARVATGNKSLLASHCTFAGNQTGGIRSDAQPGGVCNSVFLRQGAPRTNVIGGGNVDADGSADVFLVAPRAFAAVSAVNQGTLTVATNVGFGVGTAVVAADDERRLLVAQSSPTTLVLDAPPTAFLAPGMLTGYATSTVVDDPRLSATSPATAAGITPAGVAAPDAGPLGAPAGGVPGLREPFAPNSLRLLGAAPALSTGGGALAPIVLTFDRPIAGASVTADRVVVLQNGTPAIVNLSVAGATLTIAPTAPLNGSVSLRLLAGIAAADGAVLGAPLLAPLRIL